MRELSIEKKKNKGTHRSGRDKNTPVIESLNDLTPPKELNDDAKEQWKEIAPILSERKILTHADRKMLMAYCIELAKYFDYSAAIDEQGVVLELKDKKGNVVNYMKNPLCDLATKSLTTAVTIGTHFGLTPASRGKINAPVKNPETPEEKALNQLNNLRNKSKSGKVVQMKTA